MINSILKILSAYFILISMVGCNSANQQKEMSSMERKIDVQGHRGARGLMPENTVAAFIKALELGVTTLEMDLAVNKNLELVVSHEPYMNPEMCLDSLGNIIPEADKYSHNIYQMNTRELQAYDCGMKAHPRFPKQQKMKAVKPLLIDVVKEVNTYLESTGKAPVYYNIEIKSHPKGDDLFHPSPKVFSDLLYNFIKEHMDPKYVNVQSFDFRVLKYYNKTYPDIRLAVLIENDNGIEQNLSDLGFIPEIYSCDYKLLHEKNIEFLQSKNMLVIPWTVNTISDMKQLISRNVDGIITDYPDSLQSILE